MSTDPLRHHRAHRDKPLMGDSLMERLSEKVASGMGTVKFVVISTVIISGWIAVNAAATFARWDPYPFILLNLMFSAVAFYTGALVIISQKAGAKRDRAAEEADAKHREELAASQQAILNAIHDIVRVDTPGGLETVIAKLDHLSERR